MSCSCNDPFCDGYNCNNNSNGAFGLILIILLYPYLPFMIVGYELFDKNMPLTNPADIADELEAQFEKSKFGRKE